MTTAIRTKLGRLARTRKPRSIPAATPSYAPLVPHAAPTPADRASLRPVHLKVLGDRLLLALAEEGKVIGIELLSQGPRRAATKRIERGVSKLAPHEDGRDLLSRQARQTSSPIVRGALRELAYEARADLDAGRSRSPEQLVSQVFEAIQIADRACDDFSPPCATSEDWALVYGFWTARFSQVNGKAAALRPDTRSIAVRETEATKDKKARSITTASSPWKDLVSAAATASGRAEYALEMMRRAAEWWRDEEKNRERERQAKAWEASRLLTAHREAEEREEEDQKDVSADLVYPRSDVGVGVAKPTSVHEEDARTGSGGRHVPFSSDPCAVGLRDEREHAHEPEKADDGEDIDLTRPTWCSVRGRYAPRSIANTDRPCAGDGPDWVARVAQEEAALREFDARLRAKRDRDEMERYRSMNGTRWR